MVFQSTESPSVVFTAGEVLEHGSATKVSAGNDASVPYLFHELRRDQSRATDNPNSKLAYQYDQWEATGCLLGPKPSG